MNERHEIVRLRNQEKLTEREIAQRLELRPSTVHYWLAKEELKHIPPVKRGRPRVTTPALDLDLFQHCTKNPFTTAIDLRDELAPEISVDTVRKRLKAQGLKCRIPARKPFLRDVHIQKRMQFAYRHVHWGETQWDKVIFSDEKIFRASSRGPLHVYRPQDSNRFDAQYITPSTHEPGRYTVCVWMAFCKNYRNMHRIEQKTLTGEYYVTHVLSSIENHVAENGLIFMQDLSPIHTSRLATHWFEAHNIEVMDDWPPKGPDMNPVENVWAELVRRIRNDSKNRDQLWENVFAAFQQLEEEYLHKLLESMPRRMDQVIEAKGKWTKY